VERSLTALLCRTSDRWAEASAGAAALADAISERTGLAARRVGRFDAPVTQPFAEDLVASRGCLLEAGGQVDDALSAGRMPILCAAECTIALTTLPTVARHRPDAKVLWLDAHGDFNTPATTGSEYLGGMSLSGASGVWDTGFEGAFDPRSVVLCGARDLDEAERPVIDGAGVTVIGTTLETLVYLQNALDGAPTYVHLDLDVLDPEVFPARFPVADGFSEDKLFDLLDAVADACEIVGLEITSCEGDPELAARCVEPLLGFEDEEDTDGDE